MLICVVTAKPPSSGRSTSVTVEVRSHPSFRFPALPRQLLSAELALPKIII